MTQFRSVPLSLHFWFSPAVSLLSVSITAKCHHHIWLIIRLTDEAHTVSALNLCSFVMMHLKQWDNRWRAKQRDYIQRAANIHSFLNINGLYQWALWSRLKSVQQLRDKRQDVKRRRPVIDQPRKWKTLHPVFLPLFTGTGLNVSITGDRGLFSRVINDQHPPTHCRMWRTWGMWGVVHVRVSQCVSTKRNPKKYLMNVLLSGVRRKFSTHIE